MTQGFDSRHNINNNIETACQFIGKAAKRGAKLAVLPEEFATLSLTPEEKLKIAEMYDNGPIQQALSSCAKKNKIWVIGGTIPIKNEGNKIFARCIVWNEHGEGISHYDKIHLFDVKVGDQDYQESKLVQPGDKLVVVDSPLGKIGLAICYDVRFPELFRELMLKGAEMVVLPSAFTIKTGTDHWEILLKARAIENLYYLIAPAEVGVRANSLGTYGHSIIIGPWGNTLAISENKPGVIFAEIDLEEMKKLRSQFPALTHRRLIQR